ncbi:MAG: PD40 domain-containing protein [Anaerolineae bacterium]|nr:PD40 domain-containing protein [Anaerolineae bacterium]
MASEDIQRLLRTGIEAAQSGNKAIARGILQQVTDQDPTNELAWIWRASVADTLQERRDCLQKVLTINPNNKRAQQALDKLQRTTPPPIRRSPPASPTTSAAEPAPVQPASPSRADRAAVLERDAVLRAHARRRRGLSPLMAMTLGLLAVAMIALALLMLWIELKPDDKTATPTTAAQQAASAPTTMPTQVSGYRSPTPVGGIARTIPVNQTIPSTWTPTATWTPPPSPTASPTPLSLNSYTLLVSRQPQPNSGWGLYTILADGSNPREIPLRLSTSSADDGPQLLHAFDAAYSPDGQQIAFSARITETRLQGDGSATVEYEDIYLVSVNGGIIRRLTTLEAASAEDITWSPDGQEIAFASDADGDFDIYIVSIGGGAPRLLTTNDAEDRDPAWSPDGKTIAFASDRSGPGFLEIWRVAPTGANLKQLTDDVNSSYAPNWSPDGKSIVFLSNRRVNTDLYMMTAEGGSARALIVRDVEAEERDPAWSPNGEWIVFSSNRESTLFELYLIRPDGSNLQRITFEQGETRYADWQP